MSPSGCLYGPNVVVDRVGPSTFWRGTVDGYPVIVSKTLKGIAHASAATALAIERYHPAAIINQAPRAVTILV